MCRKSLPPAHPGTKATAECRVRAPSVGLKHGSCQGHSLLRGILGGVCVCTRVCVCVSAHGEGTTRPGDPSLTCHAPPLLPLWSCLTVRLALPTSPFPLRRPQTPQGRWTILRRRLPASPSAWDEREAKSFPQKQATLNTSACCPGPRVGFLGTAWPYPAAEGTNVPVSSEVP